MILFELVESLMVRYVGENVYHVFEILYNKPDFDTYKHKLTQMFRSCPVDGIVKSVS